MVHNKLYVRKHRKQRSTTTDTKSLLASFSPLLPSTTQQAPLLLPTPPLPLKPQTTLEPFSSPSPAPIPPPPLKPKTHLHTKWHPHQQHKQQRGGGAEQTRREEHVFAGQS